MSPLLDRSNPLAVRIASAVMFVAMVAALSWALTLIAKATGHPYRVLLVAGVVWASSIIGSAWKAYWARAAKLKALADPDNPPPGS